MRGLAGLPVRIPKVLRVAAVAAIQIGLLLMLLIDRGRILREGAEVTLATRPIDPRDFLRGDYVTLNYDISTLPAGILENAPASGRNAPIYVKLAPRNGVYAAVSVHLEPVPVAGNEVLILGHITNGTTCGADERSFCSSLSLKYGIERYFVPEGEGRAIEKANRDGKVAIVAAVTKTGRAAIKRLLIDGQPVYDEPWY
jgi:uncharacterized membrane-anchored protein